MHHPFYAPCPWRFPADGSAPLWETPARSRAPAALPAPLANRKTFPSRESRYFRHKVMAFAVSGTDYSQFFSNCKHNFSFFRIHFRKVSSKFKEICTPPPVCSSSTYICPFMAYPKLTQVNKKWAFARFSAFPRDASPPPSRQTIPQLFPGFSRFPAVPSFHYFPFSPEKRQQAFQGIPLPFLPI